MKNRKEMRDGVPERERSTFYPVSLCVATRYARENSEGRFCTQ